MRKLILSSALLLTLSCSSTKQVDMSEPKRVLGRENDVRVDAQISDDRVSPGSVLALTYEIENLRPTPIAFADIIPLTTYDPETRTITIDLGAEVPGNSVLPRLVKILPGEKKGFTAGARVSFLVPNVGPSAADPRFLKIRMSFLGDPQPFEALIGVPERAIQDGKLADALFTRWVESNEAITTNSVPIRWRGDANANRTFVDGPRRRGRSF